MKKQRIVGLDLIKGIAIFMMIIVHCVTQVIADYDGSIFVSIIDKIPKIVMYCVIYPLVIIGLWGTIFTFITGITTTLSCIRILNTNKRAFWTYLFQRVVFLILLRLGECICLGIFNPKYDIFNNQAITFPTIPIAGPATTLDSIGWAGIIAPIITYLVFPIIKKGNVITITIILTILVYALFGISPYSTQFFAYLSTKSYDHHMGLLGDIFGKIGIGRFKIAETAPFAVAGTLFGCMIHFSLSIKTMFLTGLSYFVIGTIVLIVAVCIDSSFLIHIVDEDVPIIAQIFSFGCVTLFTFVHCYYVDGERSIEKKYKSRKRCQFQFRLGMISLTVFCIGPWVGKQLSLPFELFFGPPCSHEPSLLLWNVWICIFFTLFVLFFWIGISYLWEKIDFKFSMEHIIGFIMAKMVGKEYTPNNRSLVYGPAEELEKEMHHEDMNEELLVVADQN